MNATYDIEFELTGYEEHCRDEAYECGDRAAMRREAEREHEMEEAYHDAMLAEQEALWAAQQADPFTSVCEFIGGAFEPECRAHEAQDEIPF